MIFIFIYYVLLNLFEIDDNFLDFFVSWIFIYSMIYHLLIYEIVMAVVKKADNSYSFFESSAFDVKIKS